ncbi:MAG TPA: hypothetical protein VF914_15310 [Chloroflexia bacterium]
MEVRRQLIKLLSDLRSLQLSNERQAFIGNMGFDRLRSKINWEGDAQAFADHLVLVLTRQGRKTLLEFITNLRESNMVGVDRKEELEKMRSSIAGLKGPQWVREFVFVAIPVKWVALGLLVLLLASTPALWFGYQVLQAPAEMTGTFNVALADFARLDPSGRTEPIEDGRTMSTWLFRGLTAKPLGPNFRVWHDSMSLTEKRVSLGIVPGLTSEERRSNAAKLAKSINADMLVYGVLTSGPDPKLDLEFYVAPLKDQADDEILGTYTLGSPIDVSLPIRYSDRRQNVEDALLGRSEIVTLFVHGLNKDKSRRPAEALTFFEQALDPQYWEDDDRSGQEVIYLFIGREHVALARDYDKRRDTQKALEEYQKAYNAFRNAKAINGSYARAYIGEGNVYYGLSTLEPPAERTTKPCIDIMNMTNTVEETCMDLAIKQYTQAVDFADRPGGSGAYANIRAHIALGGAYRAYGESFYSRTELEEAISWFDMAIEEQNKVLALLEGKSLPVYAAHANLILGATYHQKGAIKERQGDANEAGTLWEKARAAYSQCIEQASAQPGDRDLQAQGVQCQTQLSNVDGLLAKLPPR